MGWAVIEKVEGYHPLGDPDREKTDEFIHWIYSEKKDAQRLKRHIDKAGRNGKVIVRKTDESWDKEKK